MALEPECKPPEPNCGLITLVFSALIQKGILRSQSGAVYLDMSTESLKPASLVFSVYTKLH